MEWTRIAMDVRVVTLRYQESVQGFAEEAVTRATARKRTEEWRCGPVWG
jgi:hypothetical protein